MGRLCFPSVPSYGILIGWQSVCPLADCFGYQWHNSDPFFLSGQPTKIAFSLTAGDPADWTSVCPGEDLISGRLLDLFWLEMTPARDTKRWSGTGEKKGSVKVTGSPGAWAFLKFIVRLHGAARVSAHCLLNVTPFLDKVIPDGHTAQCNITVWRLCLHYPSKHGCCHIELRARSQISLLHTDAIFRSYALTLPGLIWNISQHHTTFTADICRCDSLHWV